MNFTLKKNKKKKLFRLKNRIISSLSLFRKAKKGFSNEKNNCLL